MICDTVPVSPNGVKVDNGWSNVTLPLLFTYRFAKLVPKKLTVKPMGTSEVEPSSLAAKVFVVNPDRMRIAVACVLVTVITRKRETIRLDRHQLCPPKS